MKSRFGVLAGLVSLVLLGSATSAKAVLTMSLQSGGTTITVADGGAGDSNSAAGVITFIGAVGVFNINVTTGLTAPATLGPLAIMDLNSINTSTAAGTLVVTFQNTGLTSPTGTNYINSGIGGTTNNATLSYNLGINGSSILSGGPLSGVFAQSNQGVASTASPYTMTMTTTLVASGLSNSSYNWQAQVSEPPAMLLLGIGLMGFGFWGRKRLGSSNG